MVSTGDENAPITATKGPVKGVMDNRTEHNAMAAAPAFPVIVSERYVHSTIRFWSEWVLL